MPMMTSIVLTLSRPLLIGSEPGSAAVREVQYLVDEAIGGGQARALR